MLLALPSVFCHPLTMASPLRTVSQEDYQLLASFRYALRRFLRFSEEAALSAGITPQQHQALLAIKGFPGPHPITIGELAERLQIQHHSVVGLTNRLASLKLARKVRSQEDRRQVCLQLLPKGEAILADLSAAHREQLRRMGPEMKSVISKLAE
jgi:DNA-binding MarR family transcriptional regulator